MRRSTVNLLLGLTSISSKDLGLTPVASSTMSASFLIFSLNFLIGLSVFLSLLVLIPAAFAGFKRRNNLSIPTAKMLPSSAILNLASFSESSVLAAKYSLIGFAK